MDCRIKFFSLLFTISLLPAATSVGPPLRETPKCRFSPQYSLEDVLSDSDAFVWDLLYWEGHFHQNNVGYNQANGMTFDGTLLDPITGTANFSGLHPFSAASKESLHVMILAHAVAGSSFAARFLSPEEPQSTPRIAYEILEKKLKTYVQFNQTYPGFGGFLPWFLSNETDIRPTLDWVNRVPALDNGLLSPTHLAKELSLTLV